MPEGGSRPLLFPDSFRCPSDWRAGVYCDFAAQGFPASGLVGMKNSIKCFGGCDSQISHGPSCTSAVTPANRVRNGFVERQAN